MEFNIPTTKEEMYSILNDLFYYYRVRREGYEEVNLQELVLPRLEVEQMSQQDFVQKATDLLKSQHEREIVTCEKNIQSQILELETKMASIQSNAIEQVAKVEELYRESVKKVENQVVKAGLMNSSIMIDKTVALEDSLNEKITGIIESRDEQIASINAKITALREQLSNTVAFYNDIHQMEIDKKVIELKDEYKKLNTEAFKYNNSLEEKEQRYSNTIKETKASLYLRFLDISTGEFTKDQLVEMGYYTDVIRCVRGYYDTLSADEAYRDLHAEGKLAIYLDDYYDSVIYIYKMAANF